MAAVGWQEMGEDVVAVVVTGGGTRWWREGLEPRAELLPCFSQQASVREERKKGIFFFFECK